MMSYFTKLAAIASASTVVITLIITSVSARPADDKILWRLLAPANLALMEGNVCVLQDPSFIHKFKGLRGNFRDYAQEIKNEVSAGLSMNEVLFILRRAADAARSMALSDIQPFKSDDPKIEFQQIQYWCDTEVKRMIQDFIRTHDEDHDEFEALLTKGKALMQSD